MDDMNQVDKTLGEQMADLLRRKPKKFDVAFCVGPDKIKVEAIKFILEAASPVFEREFEENWENGVMIDGNGIPLPNVDPTAFQLFVNLIILDAWSLDYVKALKLSPKNLLHLLGLCRRYEITKAMKNLDELADDFIKSFDELVDTDEFLEICRENLETIFSLEKIPLDEKEIFDCACRWARNQCTIKGLEPTGENYREVLGACLFEIRFPTMTTKEFTTIGIFSKNVLKAEEKLAVYEYIGLDNDEKTNYNTTQLPFKTHPREGNESLSFGFSVLSLPAQYKITASPSFKCDGRLWGNSFQVDQRILLHGVGFLGPIDGGMHCDAHLQIKRYVNCSCTFDSGMFKKTIFARKDKIFYFLLDESIVVEPNTIDITWKNSYYIFFSLKGPNNNNTSQYHAKDSEDESLESSGVQFHLGSDWNYGNPMAKLLFNKI